jgi:hypothetical protein
MIASSSIELLISALSASIRLFACDHLRRTLTPGFWSRSNSFSRLLLIIGDATVNFFIDFLRDEGFHIFTAVGVHGVAEVIVGLGDTLR